MEQASLLKIARLRTLAARQGRPFDVVRFAGDPGYAEQILRTLTNTDQEDLILLSLEVMNALGMVRLDPSAGPEASATASRPEVAQKYVGRLR